MGNSSSSTKDGHRFIVLGLDAAGKTTMLWKLRHDLGCEIETQIPTIGFNVEIADSSKSPWGKIELVCWDCGGKDKIRPLWRHYYQKTTGLIFVVDSTDRERIDSARDELHRTLREDEMKGVPLLVLANKQDLPTSMPAAEVERLLDLDDATASRRCLVRPTIARTYQGLHEGLGWLASRFDGSVTPIVSDGPRSSMSKDGIRVTVQGLSGSESAFACTKDPSLRQLKEALEQQFGTPCREQTLVRDGKPLLQDFIKLSAYGITEDTTLVLVTGAPEAEGNDAAPALTGEVASSDRSVLDNAALSTHGFQILKLSPRAITDIRSALQIASGRLTLARAQRISKQARVGAAWGGLKRGGKSQKKEKGEGVSSRRTHDNVEATEAHWADRSQVRLVPTKRATAAQAQAQAQGSSFWNWRRRPSGEPEGGGGGGEDDFFASTWEFASVGPAEVIGQEGWYPLRRAWHSLAMAAREGLVWHVAAGGEGGGEGEEEGAGVRAGELYCLSERTPEALARASCLDAFVYDTRGQQSLIGQDSGADGDGGDENENNGGSPSPAPAPAPTLAAHTDACAFTLVVADAPGLEVKDATTGKWVAVDLVGGHQTGWTGPLGAWGATQCVVLAGRQARVVGLDVDACEHRVRCAPDAQRSSITVDFYAW